MFFPAVVFSSPFFYLFRIFRETFLREREKKKTPRYSIADLASQPASQSACQPTSHPDSAVETWLKRPRVDLKKTHFRTLRPVPDLICYWHTPAAGLSARVSFAQLSCVYSPLRKTVAYCSHGKTRGPRTCQELRPSRVRLTGCVSVVRPERRFNTTAVFFFFLIAFNRAFTFFRSFDRILSSRHIIGGRSKFSSRKID